MPVLRELVGRLGFQVDESGWNRAHRATEGVKRQLQSADGRLRDARGRFVAAGRAAERGAAGVRNMGAAAATASQGFGQLVGASGIGLAIRQVVQLASDANETRNVLGEVFGSEGQQQVQDWAATAAESIGRSRFELEEFAGGLGAMLQPMLQSSEAAQKMSTTMAQLAVDLGSFFNTSDQDALQALRSGLAGETEPLRRFGIVMLDATLQEFARARGINKRVQEMNVAEKTELRYQFILANTTKAQGDAARTSDGYANSIKALSSSARDLATQVGLSVLPRIERMVRAARGAIDEFVELTRGTKVLELAFLSLVGVGAVLLAQLAAPFIAAIAAPAAAIAAMIVQLDDLHALFTGGTSLIGFYIDELFGLGAADEFVRNHTAGLMILREAWNDFWGDVKVGLEEGPGLFEGLEFAGRAAFEGIATAANDALNAVRDFLNNTPTGLLAKMFGIDLAGAAGLGTGDAGELSSTDRVGSRGLGARRIGSAAHLARDLDRAGRRRQEQAEADALRVAGSGALRRATGRGIGAEAEALQFGRASQSATLGFAERQAARLEALKELGQPTTATAPRHRALAERLASQVNVGGTTIHVNGGNASEVRRVVREAMDSERRKTVSAISRASQGGG